MIQKIISFFTGGLPAEIAKQVGEHIKAKGEHAVQVFMTEVAFDLELLKAATGDPLHTRQVIALTFHFFMWGKLFITGSFPNEVIFQWGETEVTIGFIYVVIIVSYFPLRAIEKAKSIFPKR